MNEEELKVSLDGLEGESDAKSVDAEIIASTFLFTHTPAVKIRKFEEANIVWNTYLEKPQNNLKYKRKWSESKKTSTVTYAQTVKSQDEEQTTNKDYVEDYTTLVHELETLKEKHNLKC